MRCLFAAVISVAFSQLVWAENAATSPSVDQAQAKPQSQEQVDPYALALRKTLDATKLAISNVYQNVEAIEAEMFMKANHAFLDNTQIIESLLTDAKLRNKAEREDAEEFEENPGRFTNLAMTGLQGLLKKTPGVMTNKELIERAKLLAEISDFYSRKDASMCRFLPTDISLLLNVDAPWIPYVNPDLLEQAIQDEQGALVRMIEGVKPVMVTDVDAQRLFSKFAGEWLASLSEKEQALVGEGRLKGNYCELWSHMLKDAATMAGNFPTSSKRFLLPLLTMPPRGWLDVGIWGVYQE